MNDQALPLQNTGDFADWKMPVPQRVLVEGENRKALLPR